MIRTQRLIRSFAGHLPRTWLLLALASGCTQPAEFANCPDQRSTSESIAMTFDDVFIENWHDHRELFDAWQAKATFFVTDWDARSDQEIEMLKELEADGHEIGCHGYKHVDAAEYVEAQGMDAYLNDQILPSIEAMEDDGFIPQSFAYPFGSGSAQLDIALLDYFQVLRQSGRTSQGSRIVHGCFGELALRSGRIDTGYTSESELTEAMNYAVVMQGTVVLHGHRIAEDPTENSIHPDDLEWIFREASSKGMEFITLSSLAQP